LLSSAAAACLMASGPKRVPGLYDVLESKGTPRILYLDFSFPSMPAKRLEACVM